jgi:hypothetical protein
MKTSTNDISLMQSQALSSLESPGFGAKRDNSWASIFSLLISNGDPIEQLFPNQLTADPLSLRPPGNRINQSGSTKELSATGRNMALADPESAYKMMTVINLDDVCYKAQYSELNQVEAYVTKMQDAGVSLGSIALSTGNDSIKSGLQDFIGQYNSWIQRINPDIQQGGLLADTQAAQVSQYELEQNLNNRFFGGRDGVHGLCDLGIAIDPHTRLASLDTAQLDALLATNKQGVVDTVQEFSANFVRSASLLNSEGNFIPRQLANLNRAIHFIADNKASLQAEFGTGNAAQPTGQVAEALAQYNQACGT